MFPPQTRAELEKHVRRVVADWAPLSGQQVERIAALLRQPNIKGRNRDAQVCAPDADDSRRGGAA
jgi:hypothetical protein